MNSINDGASPVDYKIKRFIRHENYNRTSKENDIALIELEKSVTFTEDIRPACLQQNTGNIKKVIAVSWCVEKRMF
jgi:hypothetical protein